MLHVDFLNLLILPVLKNFAARQAGCTLDIVLSALEHLLLDIVLTLGQA